jgi:hypothetical protein
LTNTSPYQATDTRCPASRDRYRVNPRASLTPPQITRWLVDRAIASIEDWPQPRRVLLQQSDHPITTAFASAWPRSGS